MSLSLGAYSVRADDMLTPSEVITLPTMTVEERRPASSLAEESSSRTVLDRATLARAEECDLKGIFRGLPGVTRYIVGKGLELLTVRAATPERIPQAPLIQAVLCMTR